MYLLLIASSVRNMTLCEHRRWVPGTEVPSWMEGITESLCLVPRDSFPPRSPRGCTSVWTPGLEEPGLLPLHHEGGPKAAAEGGGDDAGDNCGCSWETAEPVFGSFSLPRMLALTPDLG